MYLYSPPRKIRASIRRTLVSISAGFFFGFLFVQMVIEFNVSSSETEYSPTLSAGQMLNRSQMILSRQVVLEPTAFTCQSKINATSPKFYSIFIIVKTRPVSSGDHYERRLFTRRSWAREAHSLGIPVIYAIGRPSDEKTQKMLEEEHQTYGDLLQFNYIDSYYNISIKTAGVLNWFSSHGCQHVTPYLFLVDDDVLINFDTLLKLISANTLSENTLYGVYLKEIEPHPSGKWAVSLNDYPNRTYPTFLIGASTIYSSSTINRLAEKLFQMIDSNQPIFFLDDVLITGIIAEQLNISRAPLDGIEVCSYTDLYSRLVISECSHIRRVYVWTKFILLRIKQDISEIDRLIEKTIYIPWRGDFKHMRNGTALSKSNSSEKSISSLLFYIYPKMSIIMLFLTIFLLISILMTHLISSRQTNTKLSFESASLSDSKSNGLL